MPFKELKNKEVEVDASNILNILRQSDGKTAETMEIFAIMVKTEGTRVNPDKFVQFLQEGVPCIDVRTPLEFTRGHIPKAVCVPLFSNEERAVVGTCFKQVGRKKAMEIGMDKVRTKLDQIVQASKEIVSTDGRILIHCWRGGMRSSAVAWLLRKEGGLKPILLTGGYKAYRSWARNLYSYIGDIKGYNTILWNKKLSSEDVERVALERAEWEKTHRLEPAIVIIGGRTGVGKTKVLRSLREAGEQVLDLEGLAHHSGSTFGWCGHSSQPNPQQFVNNVAVEWAALDSTRPVFVEDEGPNIGRVSTPLGLYRRMRSAPLILRVNVSIKERIKILLEDYTAESLRSEAWKERMVESITGLKRRLGGERMLEVKELFLVEDYEGVARNMLTYYDKLYDKHIKNAGGCGSGKGQRVGRIIDINLQTAFDPVAIAAKAIHVVKDFFN